MQKKHIPLRLGLVVAVVLAPISFVFNPTQVEASAPVVVGPPCALKYSIAEVNKKRTHWNEVGLDLDIGAENPPIYNTNTGAYEPKLVCDNSYVALAAIDGYMTHSGSNTGSNTWIKVYNSDLDISVVYLHVDLDSSLTLASGTNVTAGMAITEIGNQGNTGGYYHIHMTVHEGDSRSLSDRMTYTSDYTDGLGYTNEWEFGEIVQPGETMEFNRHVWPANLNNDSNTDILAITSDGKITYSLSQGNGDFTTPVTLENKVFPWNDWFDSEYTERVWPMDINADGYDDILGVDVDGKFHYVLSDQNGGFSTVNVTSGSFFSWSGFFTNDYHERVFPADIDGNGTKDIVAITPLGRIDSVKATVNTDGSITFGPKNDDNPGVTFDWGTWFSKNYNQRVWAGDIDGDGKDDLLAVDSTGRIFSVTSRGDGRYNSSVTTQGVRYPLADWFTNNYNDRVWPMDMNGDGYVDLVATGAAGKPTVAIGRGDGTFESRVNSSEDVFSNSGWFKTTNNDVVWPANVDGVDANGDVNMDLIGFSIQGKVTYITSDGNNQFNTKVNKSVKLMPWKVWFTDRFLDHVWATDIDGDGHDDLLGIDSNGDIYNSMNNGDGSFDPIAWGSGSRFAWSIWFSENYQPRVWPTDVSGDGKTDILAVDPDGDLIVLIGQGGGGFYSGDEYTDGNLTWDSYFSTDYNQRVWPGDINGDDKSDLVVIESSGKVNNIRSSISGKSSGSFMNYYTSNSAHPYPWASWMETDYHSRIWTADVNGDNLDDILALNNNGNPVYSISNGDGSFSSKVVNTNITPFEVSSEFGYFTKAYAPRVFPADINGDNRADLVGIHANGKINSSLSSVVDESSGEYQTMYVGDDAFVGHPYPWADWFNKDYNSRIWFASVNGPDLPFFNSSKDILTIDGNGHVAYKISTNDQSFEPVNTRSVTPFPVADWFK